jgi:hypothetical protein
VWLLRRCKLSSVWRPCSQIHCKHISSQRIVSVIVSSPHSEARPYAAGVGHCETGLLHDTCAWCSSSEYTAQHGVALKWRHGLVFNKKPGGE